MKAWNDPRNVREHYKTMTQQEIFEDRQSRTLPFVVVLMNLTGDFNKSTAIRTANNFLAQEVVLVGNRKWDRRGAVGTHNYMTVSHSADILDVCNRFLEWEWVAVEQTNDAIDVSDYLWSPKTVLLFGEEELGLDEETLSYCDNVVSIPTAGTVRSLNVGVASGIVMHEVFTSLA